MSPGAPGSPDRSCQEPVNTARRHEQFADDYFIVKMTISHYIESILFYVIKLSLLTLVILKIP